MGVPPRAFGGHTWRFDCILPIKREEKSPQIPYFFQLYSIQNYNRLWYTGQVHSIYNYHLTTFFRCIPLAVCRWIPANYFWVKCVRFSSCQGRYFWTFPTIFGGLPKVAENFRRCSDDLFNDDILVCCVEVKRVFELFLATLNLIFIINHVLKNSSSGFLSQEWEIVLDAWNRCLKPAGVRLKYYAGELAGIYANNWLLSSRLVWEALWLFTIYKKKFRKFCLEIFGR